MDFIEGEIFAIDKPYRMSSFGTLAHIRYLLSRKLGRKVKIGHAGTLDPLATGVLVLCTGKCTKQIEELQAHTKEYVATLQLGATTASYDREHTVNHTYPCGHVTETMVREVLKRFEGDIDQVPPTYSEGGRDTCLQHAPQGAGRDADTQEGAYRRDRTLGF